MNLPVPCRIQMLRLAHPLHLYILTLLSSEFNIRFRTSPKKTLTLLPHHPCSSRLPALNPPPHLTQRPTR